MDLWLRLARYLWPYRWSVVGSFLLGLAVAALWSAELTLTFPLIKVFLQGQTLPDYIQGEIDGQERDRNRLLAEQHRLQERLEAVQSAERPDLVNRARADVLADQSRLQGRLNIASSRLAWSLWIKSRILPRLPRDQFQLLVRIFALLLVVTVVKGGLSYWQDSVAGSISERSVLDLRMEFFRNTLRLDPLTVAEVSPARWTSYFTIHSQILAGGLHELTGRVVREPLKALACIVAALCLNPRLTALSLCFIPLAAWLYRRFGARIRTVTQRAVTSMAQIFRSLEETLRNLRAVQLYDRAGYHRRAFHRQNRDYNRHSLKIVRLEAACGPLLEMLGMAAVLVAVLPGAYLVLRGTNSVLGVRLTTTSMDIAELSLLYTLLAGTLDPMRRFTKFYTNMRRTGAVAEQIFMHMDLQSHVPDPVRSSKRLDVAESIEFRNVTFHYHGARLDSRPILDGLDLTLTAGRSIAIVGSNGSGKSTLVNLLPRFFDPVEGQVLIDGVDLREHRLRDLRECLAWVPQEPRLFEGTLAENIRYGRADATSEEIRDAARQAHVLDFAEEWDTGLETVVGENGRGLSGGQRQRIALARAILKRPRLLILDEPASAVDAVSEQLIFATLRNYSRGRTVLLITHSFAPHVLSWIDEIVVMDRGRVVGQGQSELLGKTCPAFQRLLDSQHGIAA